ncbi:MAG: hypothetical protein FJZ47_24840 [Candidatus Tectomicrobia bacterium]|uniref:Uncharacterized protein n=1 Tax=Tectimicrobiota bacterium TaxID=2528274 RepID=A0A938B391_UNCTE|nr:hypothetical protein [Candidatus Tectomicrobia bacterium]
MAASEGITLEHLQALAAQVGMQLTTAELEHLKPMYDLYAAQLRVIHDLDLAAEDLAVVYSPTWDPQS